MTPLIVPDDAPPPRPSLGVRLTARLRHARRAAIDFVFPPTCIACHGAVVAAHALCPACWRGLGLIERPVCDRYGTPFAVDLGGHLLSPRAVADPPVFARCRAVARYDDVARALVHRLKYEDRMELAPALGRMMARAAGDLLPEADVIVPVPLHRGRLWKRRFNQSALLAREIATAAGKPLAAGALIRRKATAPQFGLSRAARADNVTGAFAVPDAARPMLSGRRVLLVDDVVTTGATANAASRVLLRAGAAAVDVACFALVCDDP